MEEALVELHSVMRYAVKKSLPEFSTEHEDSTAISHIWTSILRYEGFGFLLFEDARRALLVRHESYSDRALHLPRLLFTHGLSRERPRRRAHWRERSSSCRG